MEFFRKLFSSPHDRGVFDSPAVYFFVGGGLSIYSLAGIFTGKMNVGRYSENIIYYSDSPVFFILCILAFLGMGVGALYFGCRRWQQHE